MGRNKMDKMKSRKYVQNKDILEYLMDQIEIE
jgi:hypothetical protein